MPLCYRKNARNTRICTQKRVKKGKTIYTPYDIYNSVKKMDFDEIKYVRRECKDALDNVRVGDEHLENWCD